MTADRRAVRWSGCPAGFPGHDSADTCGCLFSGHSKESAWLSLTEPVAEPMPKRGDSCGRCRGFLDWNRTEAVTCLNCGRSHLRQNLSARANRLAGVIAFQLRCRAYDAIEAKGHTNPRTRGHSVPQENNSSR